MYCFRPQFYQLNYVSESCVIKCKEESTYRIVPFGLGTDSVVIEIHTPKAVVHSSLDDWLELCAEIRNMERLLVMNCWFSVFPKFIGPAKTTTLRNKLVLLLGYRRLQYYARSFL
jgi:hypothetical protein